MLRSFLFERATTLGFARVGFASVEPFESERERLQTWIAEGGAELLPYLATLEQLDPRSVMPTAKAALVGFFPYARPEALPGAAPGSARISRYLWGTDYHITLKGRLNRLLREAQEAFPGLEGRVCVDTAPVLERQLAVRAGLGWQGRHTLLIAGRDGSWGFLGVLLLDADLTPDAPFVGHRCGSCRACLDACPTGAITPFRVDPNRCLSTYTIESEAEPPAFVEEAITRTSWIAGCDACQEVCPWNRAPLWGDPELWGGDRPLHTLPLPELLLNGAQYRKHIKRTALRRVRHRTWLRNVALALCRKI